MIVALSSLSESCSIGKKVANVMVTGVIFRQLFILSTSMSNSYPALDLTHIISI